MAKIKSYVAEHPEKYQEIMSDIKAKIPAITDAQMNELTALAPAQFIENAVPSTELD